MEDDRNYGTLTAASPGFVKSYFAASRLHHLSTWKSDLIDFVAKSLAEDEKKKPSPVSDPYRIIMHVDMDCFFASVAIRDRPHLKGKPVAVAHSTGGINLDFSSSEIASCNYEARKLGVKNGMFIGAVKKMAPDLVVIPYEFEKYDECSKAIYQILLQEADYVQAVSCDEAYIDITQYIKSQLQIEGVLQSQKGRKKKPVDTLEEEEEDQEKDHYHIQERLRSLGLTFAERIRNEIFSVTQGCTASVGISHNLLLARIATQNAKPNGYYFLSAKEVLPLLNPLPIKSLPGFGHAIVEKCQKNLQLDTCEDVRKCPLSRLKQELGDKTAESLARFAQGVDDRLLENKARQSIGSDINWGIRFTRVEELQRFLLEFTEEVFERLQKNDYLAGHLTVNMKKKLYEGEPGKFLGCGHCQDYSKSMACNPLIRTAEQLLTSVSQLVQDLNIPIKEIRGIGIHLKKLVRVRREGSFVLPIGEGVKGGSSLWKWSSTNSGSVTSSRLPSSASEIGNQATDSLQDNEKEIAFPLKRKATMMSYLQSSFSKNADVPESFDGERDIQLPPSKEPDAIDLSSSPLLSLLQAKDESEHSNLTVDSWSTKSIAAPTLVTGQKSLNIRSPSVKALSKKRKADAVSQKPSSSIRSYFSQHTNGKSDADDRDHQFLKGKGIDLNWFISLPRDIQIEQLELLRHSH